VEDLMPGEVSTDGLQEGGTRGGISRGDSFGRDLNGQGIFAELDGESSEQMEFNHQFASSWFRADGWALRASLSLYAAVCPDRGL
jgi:hypothetical protein